MCVLVSVFVFFQAEDGIRDLVRSRGLGDVYKRQTDVWNLYYSGNGTTWSFAAGFSYNLVVSGFGLYACLLYTSDAADERSSVDLGGRRIIKKKKSHRSIARQSVT